MRNALYFPPFGTFAEPDCTVEVAVASEAAGWDGIFLWDHIWRDPEYAADVADVWVVLAAVAAATSTIRLGPAVVPLARRRPQKVARETVTLDRLSHGRLTVGIGLGVDSAGELTRFGEVTDDRARGDVLDEALLVLRALWSGEPVDHRGDRFVVDHVAFRPVAVQQPSIPLWGAARGDARRPVRRAAALDGLFPVDADLGQLDAMLALVQEVRGSLDGYDVAFEATSAAHAAECAAHGVTWCLWDPERGDRAASLADVLAFVSAGPPVG